MGDAKSDPVRLSFNPQFRVEFRGSTVTSAVGLPLPRELDERLGLSALIERHLTDPRTGRNSRFLLPDLVRQALYSRLAGYEDPTTLSGWPRTAAFGGWLRVSAGRRASRSPRPSTGSKQTSSRRSGTIGGSRASMRSWCSAKLPGPGAKGQSAYNGHFESVCYHPLLVFNWHGDCLASTLRPGNVRRVIAKVEHHLEELFPRIGFIVATLTGTNRAVVRFCNQRGTVEQWINEGKATTR